MSFEHKPGNFNLFKNDKDGNDKRPDYRGEGTDLQGNKVELAAWIKDGAKGKFMSVTMKTKTAQSTQASRPNEKPSNDFEDDIPF